ncbi:peptide-methionine (S)-S-oxide reductase MsrA [Paenibacillus dokdonensis]|uniref:peptide-methionine (S)-S-oxide reductase MsrA n=1 Tax=Paenibacillus dokdonensis TaxID=2567944 RepID=UPI001FE28075|nr:peptide-methionine (S)-S-oxide reductase [Paenibacillus dokdonensis]
MNKIQMQTAVLGMGCFWSPEALFGSMPGVISTRTGYAGGTPADPTYRHMGDHTKTVEFDFDPELLSYGEILRVFWDNHSPLNINDYKGRQYQSMLLYRSPEQKNAIDRVLEERRESGQGEPATEIHPFTVFYPAEEKHQKYYLKRHPDAVEKLLSWYLLHPGHGRVYSGGAAQRTCEGFC